MRRALVLAVVATLATISLHGAAQAAITAAVCDDTSLAPGQTLTVNGNTNIHLPGTVITLYFNGGAIGTALADAATGNFSVSGTIPAGTLPGVYPVAVDDGTGPFGVCSVTVQAAAATPTPTVTPTPTPTAAPSDEDDDLDADDLADILAALSAGGGGQQQQQQQVPVALPAVGVASSSGAKLPKTGTDVAAVGGLGTVSLLAGFSLMEIARRRRRNWLQPAGTPLAISAPTPARTEPELTASELDLLAPYAGEVKPVPPETFDPTTTGF